MHRLALWDENRVDDVERECWRVRRPRSAEGVEDELARVVASLDRHRPQQVGHTGVDDPFDASGRLLDGDSERLGDVSADGNPGGIDVDGEASTEEVLGIEYA